MVTIKGRVFDDSKGRDNGLVDAIVYVSDINGKLISENMRTKTDINGNYTIKTDNINAQYLTAKAPSYENYDIDISTKKIPSNNILNFDFKEFGKVIEKDEVTIIGLTPKTKCERSGGIYDSKNKKCKKPPLENWKKGLIGIGILLIVVGGIYVYKNK